MITVFTPTYNREKYLGRVYKSLLNQSYRNFQWLIIDDGSSDNTKNLVDTFINENKIDIKYVSTINGGKHRAINMAAKIAKYPWFLFLDSDDWMLPEGLQILKSHIDEIKERNEYCALCGLCKDIRGKVIGTTFRGNVLDINIFDAGEKYKISGDKGWAVRTDLLIKYPFPEFQGENFVTESTWFNMIANKGYISRYFNDVIKGVEYLKGGLTSQYVKLLAENWQGTLKYYNDYFKFRINHKTAVFSMLRSFLSVCKVKKIGVAEVICSIDTNVYENYKRDIDRLVKSTIKN